MSRLDPGHKHTNASMLKLLGESGYIPVSLGKETKEATWTMYERGADVIWLAQYIGGAPKLFDRSTLNPIDPKSLGVRNPNIQNEGSPDE